MNLVQCRELNSYFWQATCFHLNPVIVSSSTAGSGREVGAGLGGWDIVDNYPN